jgi:hypothetical protein
MHPSSSQDASRVGQVHYVTWRPAPDTTGDAARSSPPGRGQNTENMWALEC